jgi:23S rRNA (cytidine1920-2'-O)/16S rRNA (cytidine1409-2'-O)-methyltransferase
VSVDGAPATTPARLVDPSEAVRLARPPAAFVGRGGRKLEAALERFDVLVAGRRALDVGASTGGFTDCLLQHGAAQVVALDVGRAQLHERLRQDPRVAVLERTNIRTVDPAAIGAPFALVVADLSFISLGAVAEALLRCAEPDGDLVVLVKPQFEAGRDEVDAGRGVVRDPVVWRRTLVSAADALSGAGAAIMSAMVSPLRGADGNVEFFLHLRAFPTGTPVATAFDPDATVAEAAAL